MTPARTTTTPPAFAAKLGVSPEKVLSWIKSGELAAINVATRADGRKPRFVILPEALEEFLNRRAVQLKAPAVRRRRVQPADVIEFF